MVSCTRFWTGLSCWTSRGYAGIGVAKRLIGGNYRSKDSGSSKIIEFENKAIGICDKQKCISIGHKISLKTALEVVQKTTIYKMPEPVRQAHILATKTMKDKLNKE